MNSRRKFVKDAFLAVTAAMAARPLLGWAAKPATATPGAAVVPGADGMIIRSLRFLDLEMPPEFANSWLTPVPHFYVRNHMFEPAKLEAAQWKLTVGGEVENSERAGERQPGQVGPIQLAVDRPVDLKSLA